MEKREYQNNTVARQTFLYNLKYASQQGLLAGMLAVSLQLLLSDLPQIDGRHIQSVPIDFVVCGLKSKRNTPRLSPNQLLDLDRRLFYPNGIVLEVKNKQQAQQLSWQKDISTTKYSRFLKDKN